ncbi:MAG: O-antigen ligase family protein [Candidatus Gastranaerophilaceae bacterium]|jgi:putative inorganic carbon (HCO3(-)) transporter
MSIFINLIKKIDINDDCYEKLLNSSEIVKKIGHVFDFSRNKLIFLVEKSFLLKHIDDVIFTAMILLFTASLFVGTGLLGLIACIVFFLTLVKFLLFNSGDSIKSAINIPVFLYFLIAAISVAFSFYFFHSIKGYSKMIIYLGAYISFLSCLKSKPSRIPIIITILALLVGIEAFYAVYQNFVGIEDLATWQDKTAVNPEQLMNRVYGTLKPYNPNLLGGYLVAGFSALLGTFFLGIKNKLKTILSVTGIILTLAAIGLTGSRGAYIATAAISFGFVIISGHILWHDFSEKKWLKKAWILSIITMIIGVCLLILISPSLQHRVLSIFALRGDSSNSFRMNVYISTLKMFFDNSLIGIGTGNTTFRLVYGLYMITGFDALGAYCVPLEIAAESGIFALLSFLWLLFMCFIRSIKNICSNVNFENKVIISVCILSITGMMIHGLVDTVWYRPQIHLVFWLYISIIAVLTSKES